MYVTAAAMRREPHIRVGSCSVLDMPGKILCALARLCRVRLIKYASDAVMRQLLEMSPRCNNVFCAFYMHNGRKFHKVEQSECASSNVFALQYRSVVSKDTAGDKSQLKLTTKYI